MCRKQQFHIFVVRQENWNHEVVCPGGVAVASKAGTTSCFAQWQKSEHLAENQSKHWRKTSGRRLLHVLLVVGRDKLFCLSSREATWWSVQASWAPPRPRDHRGVAPNPRVSRLNGNFNVDTHKHKKKSPPVSCPHPTIQKETQTSHPASNTVNQYSPLLKLTLLNSLYGGYNKAEGSRRASHKELQPHFKFCLWTSLSPVPLCASHLFLKKKKRNQNSTQYFQWPFGKKKKRKDA